jgi:hypothetical protein
MKNNTTKTICECGSKVKNIKKHKNTVKHKKFKYYNKFGSEPCGLFITRTSFNCPVKNCNGIFKHNYACKTTWKSYLGAPPYICKICFHKGIQYLDYYCNECGITKMNAISIIQNNNI